MAHRFELVKHETGTDFRVFLISIVQRLYHWHRDVEVLLVIEGSVSIDTAKGRIVLKQNDLFVLNSNEIHSLCRTKERNVLLALQFDPRFCQSYDARVQRVRFSARHLTPEGAPEGWRFLRSGLIQITVDSFGKETGFQLKTVGALNGIVWGLMKYLTWEDREESNLAAEADAMTRLQRVLDRIQNEFTDKVSLKELAALEGLDMFYLSHFIKEHLGISFRAYLNKLRLEKAVFLISNTSQRLLDICVECGFSDYRYLSGAFLREYGCTPAQYRAGEKDQRPRDQAPVDESQHHFLEPDQTLERILEYITREAGP